MKKRIAINMLNFNSEQLAGVGYFIKRIFSELQRVDVEFKFVIFYPQNMDILGVFEIDISILDIELIPVKRINHFIARVFYEQFFFPFSLRKFKYYYSPTPAFPLGLKLINQSIRVIVTIHDLIPFYFPKKYSFFRSMYVKALTSFAATLSDKIVTVSFAAKKDIMTRFHILSDKIDVIYNFIPHKTLQKETLRNPFFLTICTIEPGKNLLNMIKAFHIFENTSQGKGFKFIICGRRGWNSESIFNLVKELGLEDKIIFTGYVEDKQKEKLLKECCALIYVSFYEGFGIPPLEAMYYSKPSVVSNISSLPEVVGKAGILCDPYDINDISQAMLKVISERATLVSEIKSQLANFVPSKECEKFINLFK